MPGKREFWYPLIFFFTIILIAVGLTWANYHYLGSAEMPGYFINYWNAAHQWLMLGTSPYNGNSGFDLPFVSILFLAPLGMLAIPIAHAIWYTVIEICLVLISILSINLSGWKIKNIILPVVLIFSLVWYFGTIAILQGQFSVIILLTILVCLYLLRHKQDGLAGFILSLSLSLPFYSLLIVLLFFFWSLAARRHQFLIGLLSGFVFWGLLATILLPDWILQWLRVTFGSGNIFNWRSSVLSIASGAVPGVKLPLSIALNGGILVLLVVEWITVMRNVETTLLWALCFTLAVNCWLRLQSNASDLICLLMVALYIIKVIQDKWNIGASYTAGIVGLILMVVPWLFFIEEVHLGRSGSHLLQYIIPGVCILGMLWVKGWAHRTVKLPFEVLSERIG